ncbi:MAG: PEGA domain-containing protein [Minicystis sp.]
MRRARAAVAALLIALAPATAGAQADVEQARIYYDAGAQAYNAGRYDAAVEALAAAYALAPRPQVLFSLAQAERRQFTAGRDPRLLRDAVAHFRRYLAEVPVGGRRADAVEAIAELEAAGARLDPQAAAVGARQKATRLMITAPTKGAQVTLDGVAHAEVPVLETVTPGPHKVRVSAPGYFDEDREVTALDGELVPVEITLRERPSFLAVAAPAGSTVTVDGRSYGEAPFAGALELAPGAHLVAVTRRGHEPHVATLDVQRGETATLRVTLRRTPQRRVAYVVLGAGAAALAGSGVLAAGTLHQEGVAKGILDQAHRANLTAARLDDYNGALATRDRLRTASLASLGIAGALVVTGLGLYLFDDPRPSVAPLLRGAELRLGPTGVTFSGSF